MAACRLKLKWTAGDLQTIIASGQDVVSSSPGLYQVGTDLIATDPTVIPVSTTVTPLWVYADGTTVPGSTAASTTYTPVAADIGLTVGKKYTLTKTGYTTLVVYTPFLGPITAVGTGVPVVANQSIPFGQLTLAGAGGTAPTNTGGAITSAAITGGTNSNHWQISSEGVITPSAAGVAAGLSALYTLSCSFTNASGTDTATITLETLPNTYSAASASDMVALTGNTASVSTATMSGKTIRLRNVDIQWPGTPAKGFFYKKAYTSEVIVTSHDNAARGRFLISRPGGVINYLEDPRNLTFYRVDFYAEFGYDYAQAIADGAALNIRTSATNFKVQECDLSSNWLELVNTYGFTTLYAGGRGSIQWTYRGIMGPTSSSTFITSGYLQFIDNTLHGSWRLLSIPGGDATVSVIGNTFYDFSGDCIQMLSKSTNSVVAWNIAHSPLSLGSDANHRDAYQFLPQTPVSNISVYGNRIFSGRDDSWNTYPDIATDIQGHFMEDIQPLNYETVTLVGNFGVTSAVHGISLYNAANSVMVGNEFVMNPAWSSNPSTYPSINFRKSGTPTVTPSGDFSADNAAYGAGYEALTATWGVSINNGTNGDINPGNGSYSTYFTGPTFTPTTLADAQVVYAIKSAGPLDTTVPKRGIIGTGYIDYSDRWIDHPRVNTVSAFSVPDKTGQATSTLITSDAVLIGSITRYADEAGTVASTNGAVVSISGASGTPEFRITSDAGGSVVVTNWTTSPAIIQAGQYLWTRITSSASSATAVTATVSIALSSDVWSVTTA